MNASTIGAQSTRAGVLLGVWYDLAIIAQQIFQLLIVIGTLENITALIILYLLRKKDLIAPIPWVILSHQLLIDSLGATMTLIVSFNVPNEGQHFPVFFNFLLCQAWDSGAIFSLFFLESDYNHILFAVMIYLSIRFPIYYFTMKKQIVLILLVFHAVCIIINAPMFTRLTFSTLTFECIEPWIYKAQSYNIYQLYASLKVVTDFFVPFIFLITFNFMIVRVLRSKSSKLQIQGTNVGYHGPEVRAEATAALLRISIAFIFSFILCSVYITLFEFFVGTKIWNLTYDAVEANLAVLSESVSLLIDPIFIVMFLPAFRRQVARLWPTSHKI